MLTSVVAMVPDISKSILPELPAVKVTPQQMQQIQMMAQMMAQVRLSSRFSLVVFSLISSSFDARR